MVARPLTDTNPRVRVQQGLFDVAQEVAALQAHDPRIGAICTFLGTVRDRNAPGQAGSVQTLELEHYNKAQLIGAG